MGRCGNSGGQWQLITRNPQDGALGIEVRERNFNLEAAGRISQTKTLSATGWRSDADTLNVDLNLPPGWRLFALFGADRLRGDWLTSWTLLDLFLVLVLSFAVFRLWGLPAALLAFVAFGLSYHEPGAPRYIWLFLLMPIALLRVVSSGWGRRVIITWKWLTIACLVIILTPFVAGQVNKLFTRNWRGWDQKVHSWRGISDWAEPGCGSRRQRRRGPSHTTPAPRPPTSR